MSTVPDNTALLLLLVALGIVVWGYFRSRPYGQMGLLSWLQSVILVAPWLLVFGLTIVGIFLNSTLILALFLASVGFYIILGRRIRQLANQVPPEDASHPHQSLSTHTSEPEKSLVQDTESETASEHATAQSPGPEATHFTSRANPVPPEDLKLIQTIFGVGTFFATETLPYQEGIIFKGNLLGDAEAVYEQLSQRLSKVVGDRYRLFFVTDPMDKPVVIVLPHKTDPQPATLPQKVLAVILILVTIATTFEAAGILLGFDFFTEPMRYPEVMPIALGVISILTIHEVAHQVVARQHDVRFGWPFFIPIIQIGTFGAFNRFESLIPNRRVLFDVAVAGPAAGGLTSLALLSVGLVLSGDTSPFQISSDFFQSSVLVGVLAKMTLGSALTQPIVGIHPLAIIGWLGLVINMINLMPAGILDGGRMMQAIYGRKIARRSTLVTFVVLVLASFVNPVALYWTVVILILQRNLERPCLNELSEPDDARAVLGLLVFFLMVSALFPLTPGLALRLGIGG
ncbi:MAG: site-2 protease family protein [Microcoleaceae cyanobacterium]